MNVALRQRKRLTVSEFIELIRPLPDDERWELLDGEAVLMSPQSERHQIIVMNLLTAARQLARARGCMALPGLGMLNDDIDDYAPIPDVVIRCGPRLDGGYAKDPVFIAEVLSPSTMSNDRGRKLEFYKSITSLQSLLIVYQDERRVEFWTRSGPNWRYAVAQGAMASVDLPVFAATLQLAEVYEDVLLA